VGGPLLARLNRTSTVRRLTSAEMSPLSLRALHASSYDKPFSLSAVMSVDFLLSVRPSVCKGEYIIAILAAWPLL
jgi:hypothetical protein